LTFGSFFPSAASCPATVGKFSCRTARLPGAQRTNQSFLPSSGSPRHFSVRSLASCLLTVIPPACRTPGLNQCRFLPEVLNELYCKERKFQGDKKPGCDRFRHNRF
jgi:hypothetical protein